MSRGGLKQRREGGDRAVWGIGGLRSASPSAESSPHGKSIVLRGGRAGAG